MSSPFVAGCAALVIDAMQQNGVVWSYASSQHARYVKMVLCATASETNANRESGSNNPTLQRAAGGPSGYPAGKDLYEGYGMINPDAAVEAVSQTYTARLDGDRDARVSRHRPPRLGPKRQPGRRIEPSRRRWLSRPAPTSTSTSTAARPAPTARPSCSPPAPTPAAASPKRSATRRPPTPVPCSSSSGSPARARSPSPAAIRRRRR